MVYELTMPLISLASGIALGVFYFGGLWLTLRRLPTSEHPALLTLGSLLGRSSACFFGFYLMAGSGLEGLVLSLVGFVAVKVALVRKLGYQAPGRGP